MNNLNDARRRLLRSLRESIHDARVLAALEKIPRERFVPAEYHSHAYDDSALPIGGGQTISQPYIVALMTQALALQGKENVLDIGTGSGYQAAILSQMARKVVTVERVSELAEEAAQRLGELGITNVQVHLVTDKLGWPEDAPYDAIIVAAAAPQIPQSLVSQLKEGGRMVIPVGSRTKQELLVVTKHGERLEQTALGGCRFVPLVGNDAWPTNGAGPY